MTKTDFKNIYEAFMHCDTNKLKKEFAAMYSDNEEQAAAVKEVDRAFARMETVTPKAVNPDEQSIIVVCKGFGDEGMTLSASKWKTSVTGKKSTRKSLSLLVTRC